jgi:hypothetical protein
LTPQRREGRRGFNSGARCFSTTFPSLRCNKSDIQYQLRQLSLLVTAAVACGASETRPRSLAISQTPAVTAGWTGVVLVASRAGIVHRRRSSAT